jgi:hypothetical protein
MYSPLIIDRRLHQAKKAGLQFQRRSRDKCIDIKSKLEKLRLNAKGELLPDGNLSRELDEEEHRFIQSERILCKADFEYYLSRYHVVERDAGVGTLGGIGPAPLLESQRKLLQMIGNREEEVHAEYQKYKHTEGIRVYAHKSRQVMFTATCRALTLHRMEFWPGTRCFAGTLNPDGAGELYKRDKLALDNLPFWLKPNIYPDVKDSELGFEHPINSRLLYQPENQKSGIGVGTQQDVSHLTEVSLWQFPYQIGYSFAPALPKSRMTLHIQEATSAGKNDYWNTMTESCRRKDRGYESWTYVFIPWYYNMGKYRSIPPPNWQPAKHTLEHVELIERTSPEWCDGKVYRPTREQIYWWETERAKYARDDKLASFLANYPATPEQSFTNWAQGALPVELLEQMEMDVRRPYMFSAEYVGPVAQ